MPVNLSEVSGGGAGGFMGGMASGLQFGLGQINQARALGLQEKAQTFREQVAGVETYLKGLDLVLKDPAAAGSVAPIFEKYGYTLDPVIVQSGQASRQAVADWTSFILNDGQVDAPTRARLTSPIAAKVAQGNAEMLKLVGEISQRTSATAQLPAFQTAVKAHREQNAGVTEEDAMRAVARTNPQYLRLFGGKTADLKGTIGPELSGEQALIERSRKDVASLIAMVEDRGSRVDPSRVIAKLMALPGGPAAIKSSPLLSAYQKRLETAGGKAGEADVLGWPTMAAPPNLSDVAGGVPLGAPAPTSPRPRPGLVFPGETQRLSIFPGETPTITAPGLGDYAPVPVARPTVGERQITQAGALARAKEPSLEERRSRALAGETPAQKNLREAQTRAADAAADREPASVRKETAQAEALKKLNEYAAGQGPDLSTEQINALRRNAGLKEVKDLSIEMLQFQLRRSNARISAGGPGVAPRLTAGGDVIAPPRAAPGRPRTNAEGADAKRALAPPSPQTPAATMAEFQRLIAAGHTKESAAAAMRQRDWK